MMIGVLLMRLANESPDSGQYLAKRLQKPLCGKRGTERRKKRGGKHQSSFYHRYGIVKGKGGKGSGDGGGGSSGSSGAQVWG